MIEVTLPLFREGVHIPDQSNKLGQLLVDNGKIDPEDLERVFLLQKQKGIRIGEAARALGLVTEEDVRSAVAQQFSYPVAPKADARLDPALVAAFAPSDPRVEALRGLRSELQLRYFDNPRNRVLALVGMDEGPALSDLTANLAVVCSQLGAKTLLVDANLREPSLHRLFSLPNFKGLADVLAGRAAASPRLCEPLSSLWLLNAGTRAPNPQELLAHQRYRNLMSRMAEKFDIILVNTPPMSANLDAQLIASRAGAVVMVVRQRVTPLRALQKTRQRLQEMGVTVLGVALSR